MKGCVKITDRIEVPDLLTFLGERALRSEWAAHDIWIIHEGEDRRLEDMSDSGTRVSAGAFLSAFKAVRQVVDGRFEGFDAGSKESWVTIEAIDSSFYLVHADESILMEARITFVGVTDYDRPRIPWKRGRKEPNQPSEPTAMSVTPPAAQEPRQP